MRLLLWTIFIMSAVLIHGCSRRSDNSENRSGNELKGSWHSKVEFSSGSFASIRDFEFMYVFNSGGTMTESSNYDAAPPVPPAYGIWRQLKDNQYASKYEFYMTKAPDTTQGAISNVGWLPSGRGVIEEIYTISPDGKEFTSKIHYDAYDQNGKLIEGGGDAIGNGQRLDF